MAQQMCAAIIVAGGSGSRLGHALPKAFVPLGGKALLLHSLGVFDKHPNIDTIIVVVPQAHIEEASDIINKSDPLKQISVVGGGEVRFQSVVNGIKALSPQTIWTVVHDAARPFVTAQVIDDILAMRKDFSCAVTATPVVDTIRKVKGKVSDGTVDRNTLVRIGTPQLFNVQLFLDLVNKAGTIDDSLTDEAMLFEKAGIPVGIAPGDPLNFKITTAHDLIIAEALCAKK